MKKFFPENITVNQAIELQKTLAEGIKLKDDFPVDLKNVLGIMPSSSGDEIAVSAVLMDITNFKTGKKEFMKDKIDFPQLPSFEGFREGRVIFDLVNMMEKPQLMFIFGHGINHPRGFGLASHVGLALNLPTIGITRDTMCGGILRNGSRKLVVDDDRVIGEMVRLRPESPALCVSPGHKVTLESAVMVTKKATKNIMPEPLKVAQEQLLKKLKA